MPLKPYSTLVLILIVGILGILHLSEYRTDTAPAISPKEPLTSSPKVGNLQPAPMGAPSASATALVVTEPPASTHDWEFISKALRRGNENVTITQRPDGTLQADLNGAYQSATAARIGEDGRIVIGCFHEFENVRDFLQASNLPKQQTVPHRGVKPTKTEHPIVSLER